MVSRTWRRWRRLLLTALCCGLLPAGMVEAGEALPAWLAARTAALAPKLARAVRYELAGVTYYALDYRCADCYVELYDPAGRLVCAPWGGLTGRGDGGCPELTRRLQGLPGRIVWPEPANSAPGQGEQ